MVQERNDVIHNRVSKLGSLGFSPYLIHVYQNNYQMKTVTIEYFRSNAEKLLKQIEEQNDALILSRSEKSNFAILPMEEYNSLKETVYLLSTTANTKRLMESIEQNKLADDGSKNK